MQEKVKCLICEREFSSINSRHLAQHGLTRESYLELYPDAELVSEASLLRKKKGAANRNQNYTEERKKEMGKKAAETRKERGIRPWNDGVKGYSLSWSDEARAHRKETGPWNKGGHLSEEQKAKVSKTKKERYASGETIHWNTGRTTSEETKQKISKACTGYKLTDEQKQKQKDAHLRRKAAGLYVNAMKGKHHSDETKRKISTALSGDNNHKRVKTLSNVDEILKADNCTFLSYSAPVVNFRCNVCQTELHLTAQMFNDSTDRSEKYCPICHPRETNVSKDELELLDFIKRVYSGKIITNDRTILNGKEIDIFLPELGIGIEYSGLYWHSENNHRHPKHASWKHKWAATKNIRLITVFSDEWHSKGDIVKSRLTHILNGTQRRIGARQLTIKEISYSEASSFLSENHIQGSDRSKIRIGGFFNEELVTVMTFKPTNFSKGGDGSQMELSRFAVKCFTTIAGAANRLLSHFRKNYEFTELISYADSRWSAGHLYKSLGFEFVSTTPPSPWYVDKYYLKRIHRAAFMKHKLDEKYGMSDEKTAERIKKLGFDVVWDCGNTKWILKNKNARS